MYIQRCADAYLNPSFICGTRGEGAWYSYASVFSPDVAHMRFLRMHMIRRGA